MSITQLITEIAKRLKEQQWKLVTAESCTGGGLAYWLTSIPGSSDWFDRGFVTYSNAAKNELLNVQLQTLEKFGAVSAETAHEMAEGALSHSAAHASIAITGIAGPDGGTADKPVGTVWIAWKCSFAATLTKGYVFSGNRTEIREQSIRIALEEMLGLLADR